MSLMEHQAASLVGKAVLGQGYDINRESFCGVCATGHPIFVGGSQASIQLDRSLSQEETASSLGFALGCRARYGVVKASLSAKFARDCMEDSFSTVTVYRAEYSFKNVKLSFDGLTPLVGQPARESNNWNMICGHEYVDQIKFGASLFISLKIQFNSAKAKSEFAASVDVKTSAAELTAKASKALMENKSNGTVSVLAFQVGGDVSRLSYIFSAATEVDPLGNKGYAIARCSLDDPISCLKLFDKAIQYASDLELESSFPNQIQIIDQGDLGTASGPAELSYITAPWSDVGILALPEILSDLIKNAKQDLANLFEINLKAKNRVQYLLSEGSLLTQDEEELIKTVEGNITSNLAMIDEVANICYTDVSRCVAEVASLYERVYVIDDESLGGYGGFLADLYYSQFHPAADKGLSYLVYRLECSLREVVNDWDGIPYDQRGAMFGSKLKLITHLDLRTSSDEGLDFNRLFSLGLGKIFASLIGLKELNIRGTSISCLGNLIGSQHRLLRQIDANQCQIIELGDLSGLVSLVSLSINGNSISDLTPLEGLCKIEHLDLGNNNIQSLQPIRDLVNIKRLWLQGNKINDLSPLAKLQQCELLNLNKNRIADFSPIKVMSDSITVLGLANNNIQACDFLQSFSKLVFLDLSGNPIEAINTLVHSHDLRYLDISGTKLLDLSPLSSCTRIEGINLNNLQGIQDYSTPFASSSKLARISADNNGITNAEGFAKIKSLKALSLRNNMIEDVACFTKCPSLVTLDLSSNHLSSVDPLFSISTLQLLNLANNAIAELTIPIQTNIICLVLTGNPVPKETCCIPNHEWIWDNDLMLIPSDIWSDLRFFKDW